METIAIMNLKGGTGKSLTAYAMSCILAERGYKVLVIDADSQGAFSEMSGVDAEVAAVSVSEILSERAEAFGASLEVNKKGFALIPCRYGFYKEREKYEAEALKKALRRFDGWFDFCIIDAPPYVDSWGENILMASDKVIIPEHMSVLGFGFLEIFKGFIDTVKEKGNPGLVIEGVLFTEATEAKEGAKRKQLLEEAAKEFGTKVFNSEIRYDERLDMARRKGMGDVLSRSYVKDDYKAFVDELLSPA